MTRKNHLQRDVVEIGSEVLTATQDEVGYLERKFERHFVLRLWWIIALILVVIAGRLFYVSVAQHDRYHARAEGNSIREIIRLAPRGNIVDRYGEVLARNVPSFGVIITPSELPEDAVERTRVITTLAEVLGEVPEALTDRITHTSTPFVVQENISEEIALLLRGQEDDLPGAYVMQGARRFYVDSRYFAHILGYEGLMQPAERELFPEYQLIDRVGKTGLERQYESVLRGVHGSDAYTVNNRGITLERRQQKSAQQGGHLELHIDAALQRALYNRLEDELKRADTRRAAAVALDPKTGAVRALVSLPSYDNNAFAVGVSAAQYQEWIEDPDRPLFNRAVSGLYPPGSTVKPMMSAAALHEGVIDPSYQIESRGGLQVGQFFFGDWRAHGFTDMARAIAVSSDVYYYTIGGGYGAIAGLGIERMKEHMETFGYGSVTGIDLPTEAAGAYPGPAWKEEYIGEPWYIGNTYHASIGQGYITATPLQVARSVLPLINGGVLLEPRIVARADGDAIATAKKRIDWINAEVERIVRDGMQKTVTEGTAQYLQTLPVTAGGKTGTAQFGSSDRVHSWFVGYAPAENPELVVLTMVERQTGLVSSSTVPVVRDVLNWHFTGRQNRLDAPRAPDVPEEDEIQEGTNKSEREA